MKPIFRVRNWNPLFETSETRKLKRLTWVPVPNKHDGKGYRRILRLQHGPLVYAAWLLILQVASKCDERGTLFDSDGGLDANDLSDKTGFPAEYFALAFKHLVAPEIAWLECINANQIPAESPATPADQPATPVLNRSELNGIEVTTACGEAAKAPPSPPSPPVQESPILLTFPIVGKGGPEWHLRESLRVELAGLFPGVDVVGESRKAEAWVRAKPTNRKTASGMRSFLTGWITRGINRGDIKASGTKPSESQRSQDPETAKSARDRYLKKFRPPVDVKVGGLLDRDLSNLSHAEFDSEVQT